MRCFTQVSNVSYACPKLPPPPPTNLTVAASETIWLKPCILSHFFGVNTFACSDVTQIRLTNEKNGRRSSKMG